MKAFVCVKQVPDTETRIKLKSDNNGIDASGVKWVMNPYDEFAVEEAIKLREGGKVTQVILLSVGPKARVIDVLRTGLAMGADDAALIDAPDEIDPFVTARALCAAIKAEGEYKIILTGKTAIDDNAGAVSQTLAEFLQIPHATVVSRLSFDDQFATVEREVEGGSKEIIQLKFPCLVAANKGLNMPRYASLPGIMKAKKKVIKEISLETLGIKPEEQKLRHRGFALPPDKPAVKILNGDAAAQAKDLVRLLKEEAKVL